MKNRLIAFLAHLLIGQSRFEKSIGVSRGFVSKVGDSIREVNLRKISQRYPELNISWLKTGVGKMLNGGGASSPAGAPTDTSADTSVSPTSPASSPATSPTHILTASVTLPENKNRAAKSKYDELHEVIKQKDELISKLVDILSVVVHR